MFLRTKIAAALLSLVLVAGPTPVARAAEPAATLTVPEAPTRAEIDAALQRGIAFLLADQRPDGSWGSAERTKDLNIYAPVPGAHQGFRAAVTSLCVAALLETGGDNPDVKKAVDRGEAWLLENLGDVRRASVDALYNVWAHGYALTALSKLAAREGCSAEQQEKLRQAMRVQIERLGRYETIDGGWGYYDFGAHTQRPNASCTSFTTGAILVGLADAKAAGVEPPAKLVERALAGVRRQQKNDWSYLYGEYLKWRPLHPVNCPGGSLGRTPCCNLARRLWKDAAVTDAVLAAGLEKLVDRNLWLDIGRKRPIPHESWFQVAGYFFYFGHYYAGRCLDELPADRRRAHQDRLATILLPLQEKDGSWWDYPLYNYHQQYGTAFALMTLNRCRPER